MRRCWIRPTSWSSRTGIPSPSSSGKGYPPGRTQAWRLPDGSGVLTGLDEDGPPDARPLLAPVVRGGLPLDAAAGITEARRSCAAELAALPGAARRIQAPEAPGCEPGAHLRAWHAHIVTHLTPQGRTGRTPLMG